MIDIVKADCFKWIADNNKKMITKYVWSINIRDEYLDNRDILNDILLDIQKNEKKIKTMNDIVQSVYIKKICTNILGNYFKKTDVENVKQANIKNKVYPRLSFINLEINIGNISNDIYKLDLSEEIKKELWDIIQLTREGYKRTEIVKKLNLTRKQDHNRYKVLKRLFCKYYDYKSARTFTDFTDKEKKEIVDKLSYITARKLAHKLNTKIHTIRQICRESETKIKRENSIQVGAYYNEIIEFIKDKTDKYCASHLAYITRDYIQEKYKHRDTINRYDQLIRKFKKNYETRR